MARKNDGFFRNILDSALKQGWRVQRTTKGHWQFIPPSTLPMVVTGNTSGDQRSVRHFLSQMRKSGFQD